VKELNQIGREELYDLVWGEAMATLAPKLGLSDVGLKKRCKNLGVPTPPRGYWAKLEAGKSVKRTALPKTWAVERRKPRKLPTSKEAARKFLPPRTDYLLNKPVQIVAATQRALAKSSLNSEGLRDARSDGLLQTKLSDASLDRGMWLWNELFSKLQEAGMTLTAVSGTFVSDGNQKITIELKEMVTKYEPSKEELDQREQALRNRRGVQFDYSRVASSNWAATGILLFRADHRYSDKYTLQWKDSKLQPLEERLDQMVEDMQNLLTQRAQEAIEAEKRRIREAEEAKVRAAAEERRRKELGRRKKLARLAVNHAKSLELRQLVDSIKSKAGESPDSFVSDWIHWAENVVSTLDPTPSMIDSLTEGLDPTEPEYEDLYSQPSRELGWTTEALETNYWKSKFSRRNRY